tara:strand:+ start:17362 stop:18555 length:1194 start_codon:yes stop_codon:yes gene_type:complete
MVVDEDTLYVAGESGVPVEVWAANEVVVPTNGIGISQQQDTYGDLVAGTTIGHLAYVLNSQGTVWLPGTLGGSYYPKGFYIWTGSAWVSDRNAIASEFEGLTSDIQSRIQEAPIDGNDYLRKDGAWEQVISGVDGESAYEIAVDEGFVGNETQWLLSLKGDQGIQGIQGIEGPAGSDGADSTVAGPQGIQGIQGIQGDTGSRGIQGEAGDPATQLTDADITALGYIKTDNDTQLSDADITALGYVKTSGKDISFFQVQDDGVTGQTVLAGYFDAINFWDTPTITDADFTFNGTLGHLTINKSGLIEIDAKLVTYNTLNNRHELYIELQKNGVSLVSDAQYASRNSAQQVGGAYIMGFKDNASAGDIYKLRAKRTGVDADIGINDAAKMSYFSAKLYS